MAKHKQLLKAVKSKGINFLLKFAESLKDVKISTNEIIKEPLVHFNQLTKKEVLLLTKKERKALGLKKRKNKKVFKLSVTLFVPKSLQQIVIPKSSLNISDTDIIPQESLIDFSYTDTHEFPNEFTRRMFEIGYKSSDNQNDVFIHYLQILYVVTKSATPLDLEAIMISTIDSNRWEPDPVRTPRGTKTAGVNTSSTEV